MRKLALACCALLILSGCAFTSNYTIDSSGGVSGTTAFGVPKSAVHNVTNLDQWAKVLQDNDIPSPTASPSDSASGSPMPAASCSPGEDLVNSMWTYSCSIAGDISVLADATNFSDLSGQTGSGGSGSSGGLEISRVGTTVTIKQPASASTGDSMGLGLKGISLMYTDSRLTFPGTVTTVTGGAVKVDAHTVSFPSDQGQSNAMTATVEIPGLTGVEAASSLTAVGDSQAPGVAVVQLKNRLTAPEPGKVEFFDGDVRLGTKVVDATGTATFVVKSATVGDHTFKATFLPADWWHVNQTTSQARINVQVFKLNRGIAISGTAIVGAQLKVGSISSTPAATSVSYQWLRNGQAIKGQTRAEYRVVAADARSKVNVRITMRKSGTVPLTLTSKPAMVSGK